MGNRHINTSPRENTHNVSWDCFPGGQSNILLQVSLHCIRSIYSIVCIKPQAVVECTNTIQSYSQYCYPTPQIVYGNVTVHVCPCNTVYPYIVIRYYISVISSHLEYR